MPYVGACSKCVLTSALGIQAAVRREVGPWLVGDDDPLESQ
jgi:hypothetical protein